MIFHRLGLINKNQKGFTLVEVMLAFVIAGIITGGITATIFQVFSGSARTSNHMTAVRQAQDAGYWVSLDAQMAQSVEPTADPDGLPLVLTWTEWDGTVNVVTYTIVDHELRRSKSVSGGDSIETHRWSIDPDPAMTSCDFTDTNGDDIEDTLILNVTAKVQQQTETRIYEVVPRPGS